MLAPVVHGELQDLVCVILCSGRQSTPSLIFYHAPYILLTGPTTISPTIPLTLTIPSTMSTTANTNMPLDEAYVMNGFHTFLANALAQAKAERLLDEDTLASAEADLMVAGKQRS